MNPKPMLSVLGLWSNGSYTIDFRTMDSKINIAIGFRSLQFIFTDPVR